MSALFSRTDKSVLGQWWWTIDRITLAAFLTLVVCGIVMVVTASPPVAERIGAGSFYFVKKHLILLGPSLIILFAVSLLSPRAIWRLSSAVFAAGLLAMILVLFVGLEVKGARRWLSLPGFSLQPSEFVKPAFAIVAAWFLARNKENPSFPGHFIAVGAFICAAALLLMQPDLGMTLVLSAIFAVQIFLAGCPMIVVVGLGLAGVAGLGGAYFVFDHVKSRIDRFLDPATGDTYQIEKALQAFREGGIFGVGPGQGTIKLQIPDAHADFIFAVASEEMGFVFALFLLAMFVLIVLRGFNRIIDSKDVFIILAAGGLLTMFGLQAFIHMGSNAHILPTKGMTLPFVSYGGSSLLAVAYGMGMVLALTRRRARSGVARDSAIAKGGMAAVAGEA